LFNTANIYSRKFGACPQGDMDDSILKMVFLKE
jgi:hypothetical protein